MRRSGFRSYRRRRGGKSKSYVKYRPCVAFSSETALVAKGSRSAEEEILLLLYQTFRRGGAALARLKADYRQRHGDKAADYLEEAWPKWQKGSTRVSVQTMERLVDLVPRVITDGERYLILKKLYDASREAQMTTRHVNFTLGRDRSEAESLLWKYASELVAKPRNHQLPEHVRKRMRWVCNEDSNLARRLMAAVEEELSSRISSAAQVELARLVKLLQSSERIEGNHSIKFPYGTIVVSVRQKSFLEKLGDVFR